MFFDRQRDRLLEQFEGWLINTLPCDELLILLRVSHCQKLYHIIEQEGRSLSIGLLVVKKVYTEGFLRSKSKWLVIEIQLLQRCQLFHVLIAKEPNIHGGIYTR